MGGHHHHDHEHGHDHEGDEGRSLERGAGKGKILFFDAFSGISGDMTISALLDLGVPFSVVEEAVSTLGLEGFHLHVGRRFRSGISCASFDVHVDEGQPQRGFSEIEQMISNSSLPISVKKMARKVFLVLGQAEAHVHQTSLEKVHFHEVGAVDSIVDIVGACAMVQYLEPREVVFSPLPMGHGFIRVDHGVLPVPAPAALRCLHGVPTYGVDVAAELVTPTGAALVSSLADRYCRWPSMVPIHSGFGSGSRENVGLPNMIRAVLGDSAKEDSVPETLTHELIEANLDDMTGELMGHVIDLLMKAGALDVWVVPTTTKKGRPGMQLNLLSTLAAAASLRALVLSETTSIGVRSHGVSRVIRPRRVELMQTKYGPIEVKVSDGGYGAEQVKAEFSDCQKAAEKANVPVREVIAEAMAVYRNGG